MADVAIVGGGLVGQLTALMLARRGHQVVVLDADAGSAAGTADDDFGSPRPGVPQGQHGHVFRARVSRVLREEVPDVIDAMLDHGIPKAGFDFGDGYQDDFALMARRPVLEAVLRRVVAQEAGVEVRADERVSGLTAAGDGSVPRVSGVRTQSGDTVPADLVIDCGGRRSAAPRWLAELGAGLGLEHYQPCDLHYFARHYRLLPGAEFPSTRFPDGAFTPYGIFLAMGEDNGTFCLAGALSKADPYRSSFRDEKTFDRVMAALPRMQTWASAGTPITDVRLMGGLANRRRSLLEDGRPTVTGLLLLGDASLYTNATFGQGVALGFWQAQALAHQTHLIGQDHEALLREVEGWTNRVLGPRYAQQVQVDEAMVGALRAGVAGGPLIRTRNPGQALAAMGAQGDAQAGMAFYRIDNLLTDLPAEVSDPRLHRRLETFLADIEEGSDGPGPLPRAAFEAIVR
jgi:2-polyprenyl-6-methoxyphenol hydroxylase-like FAD-dependent oxidoreductase